MIETKCYNGEVILKFDEVNHRFYAEGKPRKSVTSFDFKDKYAVNSLQKWAAEENGQFLLDNADKIASVDDPDVIRQIIKESIGKYKESIDKAADIGTQAHKWAEKFVKATKENKKPPPLPKNTQVYNAVMAFLGWIDENNVKFLESEMHVYNRKYKYAGILDAIGLIKGKRVLIDFKTGKRIYSEAFFQTAGYQLAYEEMTEKEIAYRLIVKFGKEDGEFETKRLEDYKIDKKGFLACLVLKTINDNITKQLKKKL